MPQLCFQPIGAADRSVAGKVTDLAWNPCLDLLALVVDGTDVVLQRLFWKKAWQYKASTHISCIAWHPTGQCLSVALSDGTIVFLDLENGQVIHRIQPTTSRQNQTITHMKWTKVLQTSDLRPESDQCNLLGELQSLRNQDQVTSTTSPYGSLANPVEPAEDDWLQKVLRYHQSRTGTVEHSILTIIVDCKQFILLIDGAFPLFQWELPIDANTGTSSATLQSTELATDLSKITLQIDNTADGNRCLADIALNNVLQKVVGSKADAKAQLRALWSLSYRCTELSYTIQYIEQVVRQMNNTWEDLLLEIDVKFSAYAKQKSLLASSKQNSTVADDLIVLLALGTASAEMEQFLLHTLTDKGLKKITQSLDTVYQKLLLLVTNNLTQAAMAATYHSDVLVQLLNNLGCTDVSSRLKTELLAQAGSTALKVAELGALIDTNRRQLIGFFKWLHAALCRLNSASGDNNNHTTTYPPMDGFASLVYAGLNADDIPSEAGLESVDAILAFIQNNFSRRWTEEIGASGQPLFQLEQVGQYLKSEPLAFQRPKTDHNWWTDVQNAVQHEVRNAGLQSLAFIHNKDTSLVQEVDRLKQHVFDSLNLVMVEISSVECQAIGEPIDLGNINDTQMLYRNLSYPNKACIRAFIAPNTGCHIQLSNQESISFMAVTDVSTPASASTRQLCVLAIDEAPTLTIQAMDVYNDNTMILLILNEKTQQQSIVKVNTEKDQIDLGDSSVCDSLKSTGYTRVHVCGARRVAALVTSCGTRVRLLDMEPDEDSNTTLSLSATGALA